nr:MAG TPA: hypothetical protein [Bacteriophage sp.]
MYLTKQGHVSNSIYTLLILPQNRLLWLTGTFYCLMLKTLNLGVFPLVQ